MKICDRCEKPRVGLGKEVYTVQKVKAILTVSEYLLYQAPQYDDSTGHTPTCVGGGVDVCFDCMTKLCDLVKRFLLEKEPKVVNRK